MLFCSRPQEFQEKSTSYHVAHWAKLLLTETFFKYLTSEAKSGLMIFSQDFLSVILCFYEVILCFYKMMFCFLLCEVLFSKCDTLFLMCDFLFLQGVFVFFTELIFVFTERSDFLFSICDIYY